MLSDMKSNNRFVEKGLEGPCNYKSPQSPEQKGHKTQLGTVIAIITPPPNTRFLVNELSHLHSHCLYINNTLCKQKSVIFINDYVGGGIFTSIKHPTQKFPFHNRFFAAGILKLFFT